MYLNTVFKYNVFKYCPALKEPQETNAVHQCSKCFYVPNEDVCNVMDDLSVMEDGLSEDMIMTLL